MLTPRSPFRADREALRGVAVLLVVAATLAATWAVHAPIDRAAVASTARSVALGTADTAVARDALDYLGGVQSPLLHSWSLAAEEQVSLFGPLLVLGLATLDGAARELGVRLP